LLKLKLPVEVVLSDEKREREVESRVWRWYL